MNELTDSDVLVSLFTELSTRKEKIDPKDYRSQLKGIQNTLEVMGLKDSNLYRQVMNELKEKKS